MTHLLHFDDLQAILHHSIAHLPDHRKPSPNTRYTIPTVSPLITSLLYCHINGFQRASNMEKPWPGGEKRMDGWAAHPVEL